MQLQGNRKHKNAGGSSYLSWQPPQTSEETDGYMIYILILFLRWFRSLKS